ncbi:hypothetical protein KIPB_017024, partial [Kipferlia bialata]
AQLEPEEYPGLYKMAFAFRLPADAAPSYHGKCARLDSFGEVSYSSAIFISRKKGQNGAAKHWFIRKAFVTEPSE